VGTVFQKPLLFPHLSVEGNVGFGLRAHGVGRRQARDAVAAMLERVQLAGLADRRVGELSGGQEQRVALARALVLSPRVLLLDEPFSQLDSALRSQMRSLVRSLVDEAGVTTLFVTHDQAEAVEVADQIALLLDGRLVGHTAPQQFWTRPPSLDAARFFGVTNELRGVVSSGRFTAAGLRPVPTDAPNGSAVLVVRPESLRLDESAASDLRVVGTVQSARFAGTHVAVDVSLGDDRLLVVHVPLATPVVPGARVTVTAAAAACTVLAEP
jgi:putative spermidine/putrescine transport system ATP-binding protein